MEGLEASVEGAARALMGLLSNRANTDGKVVIPFEVAADLHLLWLRTTQLSPHLSARLSTAGVEGQSRTPAGVAVSVPDLTEAVAVMLDWLNDPPEYERRRPSVRESTARFMEA
jgi:hypothetical protein